MEVAVEKTSGLERRMTVALPEERVAGEVASRLQSMTRTVRVPGFRPGKVPLKVLARRYGNQIRDEVVGEFVRSSFIDAVTQEKLKPAGGPVIDPLRSELGQGVSYTAVFEVYPEVTLAPLESLEIARPEAEATDADVASMIETLRKQRQTWEAVERGAAGGDRLTIDFTGRMNGEEFEGGSAQGATLMMGSSRMIPGFESGLEGAKAGDRVTLDLEFPADYPSESLAGKPVAFEVVVHAVEAPVLPDVDEEFIRGFGVEEGTVEAFEADIRANIERELADAVRARLKERVMDALLEQNSLEVPKSLVGEEIERLLNQRRQEFSQHGLDPERMGLDRALVEAQAERRVRLGLLLAEVVKAENLKPDPEKVRAVVERMAAAYEDPGQVISWYYGDKARLAEIESSVLEDEIVAGILERAQVTIERTTFDGLLNPGQTSD